MDLLASASAAGAGSVTWRDLAANPGRYIGKEVVIASAYCGNAGDDPGYVCSTDGPLYVRPLALADGPAKLKLDENCGGMDWVEKSAFCRVKTSLHPQRLPYQYGLRTGQDGDRHRRRRGGDRILSALSLRLAAHAFSTLTLAPSSTAATRTLAPLGRSGPATRHWLSPTLIRP